jgi:4-carboxymuconolactone decarboxylase
MKANTSAAASPAFPDAGLPERLAPPKTLDPAQQEAADELVNGPRGGVYGPFRPLLHRPALLRAMAKVGETLRYDGALDPALREWTICVVARELSNVFEWDMHLPLAEVAGVPHAALVALEHGSPVPDDLQNDLALSRTMVRELISRHRVDDETYALAVRSLGEPLTVELLTLVGYFVAVCWLMNVARTPGAV